MQDGDTVRWHDIRCTRDGDDIGMEVTPWSWWAWRLPRIYAMVVPMGEIKEGLIARVGRKVFEALREDVDGF